MAEIWSFGGWRYAFEGKRYINGTYTDSDFDAQIKFALSSGWQVQLADDLGGVTFSLYAEARSAYG